MWVAVHREADPGDTLEIAPLAGMVSVPAAMVSFLLHNCDHQLLWIHAGSCVEAEV